LAGGRAQPLDHWIYAFENKICLSALFQRTKAFWSFGQIRKFLSADTSASVSEKPHANATRDTSAAAGKPKR
jgi:hypothetical protein